MEPTRMIHVEHIGDWQLAVKRGKHGVWCAWAKMGRIVGPDALHEPGEHVWFQFGLNESEAVKKLKEELGLIS